ncbi:MAG: hypothetical protein QOC69_7163 [Mycobacterium sp.]|jgi:hypothetical protein|nr:hypothetical protein [Mycobacterium sp.]
MMTRGSSETTMTINLREENAYTLGAQPGCGLPSDEARYVTGAELKVDAE